jgi:hypothetical protein
VHGRVEQLGLRFVSCFHLRNHIIPTNWYYITDKLSTLSGSFLWPFGSIAIQFCPDRHGKWGGLHTKIFTIR